MHGCDVAPIDLADPEQALRLKAYIWADAAERMGRMEAAIMLAQAAPPDLVRMDAGEFVARRLAAPQDSGVTRVLFHTVMWQYLPQSTREAITAAMEEAGAKASVERSIAWIAAGRPRGPRRRTEGSPAFPEYDRPGRAAATDPAQDEEFLRKVRERAEEQRRRYDAQRRDAEGPEPTAD